MSRRLSLARAAVDAASSDALAQDITLSFIECLHARKFPGLVGWARDAVLEFPGPDVSGLQARGRISLP